MISPTERIMLPELAVNEHHEAVLDTIYENPVHYFHEAPTLPGAVTLITARSSELAGDIGAYNNAIRKSGQLPVEHGEVVSYYRYGWALAEAVSGVASATASTLHDTPKGLKRAYDRWLDAPIEDRTANMQAWLAGQTAAGTARHLLKDANGTALYAALEHNGATAFDEKIGGDGSDQRVPSAIRETKEGILAALYTMSYRHMSVERSATAPSAEAALAVNALAVATSPSER